MSPTRTHDHAFRLQRKPETATQESVHVEDCRRAEPKLGPEEEEGRGTQRVCTCRKAQAPPAEQPCSPSSPGTSSALPSFPGRLLKCPLQTEQGSKEQSSTQSTPRVFPNTPTATTATLSLPSCRQTLAAPSQGILVLFSAAKKAE